MNKAFRFLVLITVLFCAGQALGATYYVCKGDGAPNYIKYSTTSFDHCTVSGTGTTDLSEIRFVLNAGDTVIMDGGPVGGAGITYSGTDLDAAANSTANDNATWRGCDSSDYSMADYADHCGPVIIDGSGFDDDTMDASAGGTWKNLTIKGAATNRYGFNVTGTANQYFFENVTFTNNWRHVNVSQAATVTFNRCTFSTSANHGIYINNGTANVTVNYSIFKAIAADAILSVNGNATVNNCIIIGYLADGVATSATANTQTITINNSYIGPSLGGAGFNSAKSESSGDTFVANNSVLLSAGMAKTAPTSGVTENNGSNVVTPKFTTARRPAIVSIVVDDAYSASNFVAVASIAESYGFKIGWSVDTDNMDAEKWAQAVTYQARGHDIISHSKSHPDLTTSCPTTGSEENCVNEVTGSKTTIETNIPGYTVRTMVNPGSSTNAAVRTAQNAAGYIGAGIGQAGGSTYLFSSISKFMVYRNPPGNLFGLKSENPTEAQIRSRTASLCEYLNYNGGWVTLMLHDNDINGGDSDMTPANLEFVFDVLSKSNVQVMTFSDAMQYVISNAESTSGSGESLTYTRSEAHLGDAFDARLAAGSSAIDAGTAVTGLHTSGSNLITGGDAAGNTKLYGSGIDIGAYERKKFLFDDDEMIPLYYKVP